MPPVTGVADRFAGEPQATERLVGLTAGAALGSVSTNIGAEVAVSPFTVQASKAWKYVGDVSALVVYTGIVPPEIFV